MVVMSNKALWLPKGTPDDVIKAYGTAMKKIYKDKKFKKLTKKTFGNYPQSFGKSAAQVVKQGTDIPAATNKWMVDWIKKNLAGS
jgi:tripartite-type tricarboxylate transporter receptor subunit TctC